MGSVKQDLGNLGRLLLNLILNLIRLSFIINRFGKLAKDYEEVEGGKNPLDPLALRIHLVACKIQDMRRHPAGEIFGTVGWCNENMDEIEQVIRIRKQNHHHNIQ